MANQVAYGFHSLANIFDEKVTSAIYPQVTEAIEASVAEHNRQITAVMNLFATPTTEFKVRYQQMGGARNQPLDEFGRSRPILPGGYYDIGFPLRDSGNAWGATFKAQRKMTVGDVNRITSTMLNGDIVWMRDQALSAMFASASYVYTDPEHGSITVEPLANGDAVTYQRSGSLTNSVDTHQYAQAAAIADITDPYPILEEELTEHPENSGDVIALISTSLVATTKALTAFHQIADPNVELGANSDRLVGGLNAALPGELLGYHDGGVWISEWKSLPSGYMILVMSDSERPLAMREEPEESLRGFVNAAERTDWPYTEQQWIRSAGFGAWNRVGAVVARIGNGTYAVPTGYTPPIP